MAEVTLLPHNEKGYKKLITCLDSNQMAAINHATGTGKSFILLKYLYENRNKRILYLAPTYPILDQLKEEHMEELGIDNKEFAKFDTMIYRTLLGLDMEKLAAEYDIIILDEYHRCGSKKCGIKVNKLLQEIKEKYSDKKVIGTTATEIRYLDNERNMNNILFDGVEASRLTLADAILDGILPAPVYIHLNYNLLEDLEKIEKRIDKYVVYKDDKMKYYSIIQNLKNSIENTLSKEQNNKYLKHGGKIIAFSSTIESIEKDKEIVNKVLKKIDTSYKIHSGISKEKNKEVLKKFRNAPSDQTTVLYSIDILNQGVHVKDVDKVFMMRKTTSPIIYFQQLGRLLSYSRRKDEVVVLDFVNNIKRHPAIYHLYNDIVERAKQLIVQYPEKKEKYQTILNRFKIVDEVSKIAEGLEKYKIDFSRDKLLEKRLYTAVSILESFNDNTINEAEKYQAILDINKYPAYINIELFERINKIPHIVKPPIFNLTIQEFKDTLNGKTNLKQKFSVNLTNLYKSIQDYIDINNKLPHIFSPDVEEKELAKQLLNNINRFNDDTIDTVRNYITPDLSLYERIAYGEKMDNIDYQLLMKQVQEIEKLDCRINYRVYILLSNKLNGKELDIIDEESNNINDSYNAFIKKLNKKTKNNNTLNEYSYHEKFQEILLKTSEELKKIDTNDYIEKLYNQIKRFILTYKKEPEYVDKDKIIPPDIKRLEQELFCKKIILKDKLKEKGYLKELDDLILKLKTEGFNSLVQKKFDEYMDFIFEHNGSMPSINNKDDEKEVELAKFYSKNYANLTKENIDTINEVKSKFLAKKEKVLEEYIEFLKEHNRKPLAININGYELELLHEFNRWSPYFTQEERNKLVETMRSINKYKGMRDVYLEMKKNKQQKK